MPQSGFDCRRDQDLVPRSKENAGGWILIALSYALGGWMEAQDGDKPALSQVAELDVFLRGGGLDGAVKG